MSWETREAIEAEIAKRDEARIARDEAIQQSEDGTDVLFHSAALDAIERTARSKPEFIADDVKVHCNVTPRESRAWGGVLRRAERNGWIRATDRVQASTDRTCHARRKAVWQSLIYEAPRPMNNLFGVEVEVPRGYPAN